MIRVMFVDDEPNVLSGLRRMLRGKRLEWDMRFEASGPAALAAMQESPYDVIVSDMRMPGMDGAELLSRVRQEWPDTVRLVLSGQSDQEMTLRAVGPAHQYLTKPCDPELLQKIVERTLAANSGARHTAVSNLIASIDPLPSLPRVYTELVAELNSPHACAQSVGSIISSDVGMSARVLQLINSSFFGLPVHVTDVEHATALLGLNVIRPLVLSTSVFRQYEQADLGQLNLSSLVDHSLCVAMLARRIAVAEHAPSEMIDNSLLAGLMHDVGQVVLAKHFKDKYSDIIEHCRDSGSRLVDLEVEAFGLSHAEIGGRLLSLWGLPSDITEAVTHHHTPDESFDEEFSPLTAVHAAEVAVAKENEGIVERETYCEPYLARVYKLHRTDTWRNAWEHPSESMMETDAS